MRLTKEQIERNRRAIVDAASRLFRERGFDGVGLNELMSEAGFTHGGFYNHFASKEALAAEVCRCTFAAAETERARSLATMAAEASKDDHAVGALGQVMLTFLSPEHRDNVARGCPSVALVADAARQGKEMQAAFARGIETSLATFADLLRAPDPSLVQPPRDEAERRLLAAALTTQMVGALILSRAVSEANPGLSDELLAAGRDAVVRLRTAPKARAKRRPRRT